MANKPSTPVLVTDLTVQFRSDNDPSTSSLDPQRGHWVEKDLYLYSAKDTGWIYIQTIQQNEISDNQLVVVEIKVGRHKPGSGWESRPAGIWVRRVSYGDVAQAVTDVDVLFGIDAVDPRPGWTLIEAPLLLNVDRGRDIPVPRLSINMRQSKIPSPNDPDSPLKHLRVNENGKLKILQISDAHVITGPGTCKDAIDAHGNLLPPSVADPLTVSFIERILDDEKPDLALLTGDQIHHDVLDSQSALFKVVAPLISRGIHLAAVFGNHDAEGAHALSRTEQMSLLQSLPFSLCDAGPEDIDGVGNYYLQIYDHSYKSPLVTLFLLDSHGQIPSDIKNPDYDSIKPSQISWFKHVSQELREARIDDKRFHTSLAFMHIPFPEYAHKDLELWGGQRREPTEGPSVNSHFYDALVEEGVVAVGCGHDHVNDFCGLLSRNGQESSRGYQDMSSSHGPWLCYGGGSGFGGYCSYGDKRYHRRMRVWDFDTDAGNIITWKRLEYTDERVDELMLVQGGRVVIPE
ncbi:Metallo-dependent phosphatase-like protein [Xylariaceae sp. FL0255]|nr:Metallo-dependent phosphatase-like protein [Xylariaceae sp. FL0255]